MNGELDDADVVGFAIEDNSEHRATVAMSSVNESELRLQRQDASSSSDDDDLD